ncbi:MAG: delta-60 repeat domain-containing protein, partial [Bacteroidota bacterium]|nr:delta-60 repeat domain-containing protein [Bacteroidota bacterium]
MKNHMQDINLRLDKKGAIFLYFMAILGGKCFGQAGSLDVSFGSGGKVATTLTSSSDYAYSVAIQTDEKLVVGGRVNVGSGNQRYDFGLTRYRTNGLLDSSFGINGKVTTDFFNSDDICSAVAMQSDQKIIATGYADNTINAIPHVIAVTRYNVDGVLDNTFGTNGKVIINYGYGENFGKAISILPDGKILIAGTAIAAPNVTAEDFALIKLKINGDLDSSFGNNGKLLIDFARRGDNLNSMTIQFDGKIILGGYTVGSSNTKDFCLVRVNINGSIDSTFGNNGRTITDFQNTQDICNSISLQSDGKIVAAGYTNDAFGYTNFSLCRYLPNGNLDSSFGTNGKRTTFTNADYTQNNAAVIQTDDKII